MPMRNVCRAVCALICITSLDAIVAAEPATVGKAAAVWNGLTWAVPKDVKEPQRQIAALGYVTGGDAQAAFDFQKKALVAAKWKEEPGAYLSKESCSATYRKDGYALSLMSFPVQPGRVNVTITAHGNVDLGKLPVPAGAKSTFAGPVSAMFMTEASPEKTAEAVTGLLTKQGWQPYGSAGDVRSFKQNAVKLNAFIAAAPPQGGKTSITYSTELMSADLPAPLMAINVQYADTTKALSFDTSDSFPAVVKFYQSTLGKAGWEATTENLIKVDFRHEMIFRNPAKDMLTLQLHEFEGKTRGLLKHDSAAEVDAKYEREKAAATKAASKKPTPSPKVAIKLPVTAKDVKVTEHEIKFTVAAGQAKTAAQSIAVALKKDGWKVGEVVTEAMAGTQIITNGDATITVIYLDTGFLPAEVTVSSTGVTLERAENK